MLPAPVVFVALLVLALVRLSSALGPHWTQTGPEMFPPVNVEPCDCPALGELARLGKRPVLRPHPYFEVHVVPGYFEGSADPPAQYNLTLATFLSVDRMPKLLANLRKWQVRGRMSHLFVTS